MTAIATIIELQNCISRLESQKLENKVLISRKNNSAGVKLALNTELEEFCTILVQFVIDQIYHLVFRKPSLTVTNKCFSVYFNTWEQRYRYEKWPVLPNVRNFINALFSSTYYIEKNLSTTVVAILPSKIFVEVL
ncbi:hypothetical protein EGR_11005 [Echinococcus granulosus]|uniref:Uncharacterized protein n=1 Tax=Echinococcus granulosus TaxID=6210 RepID=W6TZB2_ECHGR|nr:hypothetical protein EGR_11005 [Echinococcus granulosus]EUB54140.1 hypothetical protein EGR_11005 [Echinococcus granulosus]